MDTDSKPTVALYITCLVNTLRPQVAWDTIALLESLGMAVAVPEQQTCCGQPGYNNGHDVASLAKQQIIALEPFDWVVVPSGSCAGMIKNHYPTLFTGDVVWESRSENLSNKTFELSEFLVQNDWRPALNTTDSENWAHHTSCSCRRDVRTHQYTEALLQNNGTETVEFAEQEVCCGFGGTFSEKFSAIAERMATNKLQQIKDVGTTNVVSADLGCLMHLEKAAKSQGDNLTFKHLAEILQPAAQKKEEG